MPMPEKISGANAAWEVAASYGGIAAFCGALSYLLKVEEGKPFKVSELLLHTVISGVFGYLAGCILETQGVPTGSICSLCGVAGWGGTRLIRLLEVAFVKRLGVTREDLHDSPRN